MSLPLFALLFAACTGTAPPAGAAGAGPPAPVRVEAATPASLDRVEEAVGVVETLDSVEVRPEASGLVEAVSFEEGQSVRKGAVLVRLRDADAQAGLLDAQARARLAKLALERIRSVAGSGDVSQAELDKAEADDQLARAAVQKAEETLRKTRIVAPFDGVLGRRDVSVGQAVDPTRVLTRIEALNRLTVDVTLPEEAAMRVAVGQAASITVDALPDAAVEGTVRFVAPRVREDSRTLEVRVAVPSTESRLRPGMTARVRIVTEKVPDALLVPTEAIVPSATGASVWVVGEGEAAALKPVTTGERSAERVEVRSGLAAGDRVIVEGLARLRPGAKVQVLDPAAK